MSNDDTSGQDVIHPTEQQEADSDRLAWAWERVAAIARRPRRPELDHGLPGLDVQQLDATMLRLDARVASLSEEVRQLGRYVRRLETKLDLNTQVTDYHLHTIMKHIGIPFRDTLHSRRPDGQSRDDPPSPPGEVGG